MLNRRISSKVDSKVDVSKLEMTLITDQVGLTMVKRNRILWESNITTTTITNQFKINISFLIGRKYLDRVMLSNTPRNITKILDAHNGKAIRVIQV